MVEFRRSLAASFLFRFFLLSSYQLAADAASFEPNIPDTYKSAVKVCKNVCSQVCGCSEPLWWHFVMSLVLDEIWAVFTRRP